MLKLLHGAIVVANKEPLFLKDQSKKTVIIGILLNDSGVWCFIFPIKIPKIAF